MLMAIHLLNCSVDAPDPNPESTPEDLSFNEMESLAEIVLEKAFHFASALPEHDEDDSEQQLDSKLPVFCPYRTSFLAIPPISLQEIVRPKRHWLQVKDWVSHVKEIHAPPPKCMIS
jgi:hypothetical protein